MNPTREFTIEHADKVEQFLERFRFRELAEEQNVKTHDEDLAHKFKESSPKNELASKFQILLQR